MLYQKRYKSINLYLFHIDVYKRQDYGPSVIDSLEKVNDFVNK